MQKFIELREENTNDIIMIAVEQIAYFLPDAETECSVVGLSNGDSFIVKQTVSEISSRINK
jgi:hypothetical protein